jgi:hypothetical protein
MHNISSGQQPDYQQLLLLLIHQQHWLQAPRNTEMTISQQGQSSKLLKQALEKSENVKFRMNRNIVMWTNGR